MMTDVFNQNIVKIITLFSISPGSKFTRNEIKEKTYLHNIPLDNTSAILLNNKIIIKEKRLLSLNFENEDVKKFIEIVKKEYIRFKEIPLKIYFILIDVCYVLSQYKNIKNIYLFGSFAKLIHTEKSDIDLAIILTKEDKNLIKKIKADVNKLEKKYNKVIEGHFFELADLKFKDPILTEVKKNSVLLF